MRRMEEKTVFGEKLEGIEYWERTGAYGIAEDSEGRVAAVRLPYGYFLIGGGIEPGEDREEALKREFLEETGFGIEVLEYIGEYSGYYYSLGFARYMHGSGHFYRVRLCDKQVEPVEADHSLVFLEKARCIELLQYDYQRAAVKKAFAQEDY